MSKKHNVTQVQNELEQSKFFMGFSLMRMAWCIYPSLSSVSNPHHWLDIEDMVAGMMYSPEDKPRVTLAYRGQMNDHQRTRT